MRHVVALDEEGLSILGSTLFPRLLDGEAVLFLGAGASVADDRVFLSKQIVQYFSDAKGLPVETEDLTEFVDILSATEDFVRNEFDDFVVDLLRKLRVDSSHRTIATIPWRQIITTNFDSLVEQAYDHLRGEGAQPYELVTINKDRELFRILSPREIKLIKLNGSVTDKREYPLVISSEDFRRASRFYKLVLKDLQTLSDRIEFLSVGYSFTDRFSRQLLSRFDNQNYRERRWITAVDPFVTAQQLPYYEKQRIRIVRCTSNEFFAAFSEWRNTQDEDTVKRRHLRVVNRNNERVNVHPSVLARLGENIVQLNDTSKALVVSAVEFYSGQEPTYDVIRKGLDVIKANVLDRAKTTIRTILANPSLLVPLVFLKGHYGSGKTTFGYRLVHELLCEGEFDAIAFEIVSPEKLSPLALGELFAAVQARTIVLIVNSIELDSVHKAVLDLRNKLSIEQFSGFSIIMLASVRENVLQSYETLTKYKNCYSIDVDTPLTRGEAEVLVDRLQEAQLVHYRDQLERKRIVEQVVGRFGGDSFVSLISLLQGSNHAKYVSDAYQHLSKEAQKAYLYTALLHRFGLLMPWGLLRNLVSQDWESFNRDVVVGACTGILIQQQTNSRGTEPDIYFRTKHPIIADTLCKLYLQNEERVFDKYHEIVTHLSLGYSNAQLIVNLLKAIRREGVLASHFLDRLFDSCWQTFAEDAHFIIQYAIVLQHRGDIISLEKAIQKLSYAESCQPHHNHRLVHRRAVVNAELARQYFGKETELYRTLKCVTEARELFRIKRALDPCSSYSYADFLQFEMWCLERIGMSDDELLAQRITIEDLFEDAESDVVDDKYRISVLRARYLEGIDSEKLDAFLEAMYGQEQTRPYALVLRLKRALGNEAEIKESKDMVEELEGFSSLVPVRRVLFRYYGSNLSIVQNRVKLFALTKGYPDLEETDPIRYHYYAYVAEAYNRNFKDSRVHASRIRSQFAQLNPSRNEFWLNPLTGTPEPFAAILLESNKAHRQVRVIELQLVVSLMKDSRRSLAPGMKIPIHLRFFLTGIRAEQVLT